MAILNADDYLDASEEVEEALGEEQRRNEMTPLIERLRAQGFTISCFVLAVPVLFEGTLPNGERFTFRCRGQKCALTVAGETFTRTTRLDGTPFEQYEAGHLGADETAEMLAHLLDKAGRTDVERRVRAATA